VGQHPEYPASLGPDQTGMLVDLACIL